MTAIVIAPIGTCRLNTPLRRGLGRFPIRLSLNRNFGFVHTSAEALQQLRFMRGEITIPDDVGKLVFRTAMPTGFNHKPHEDAELYLVEISSAKLITLGNHPVQMNYTHRYFSDFFVDKNRNREFWAMATPDRMHERNAWLAGDAAYQRLDAGDRRLLGGLQIRELTQTDIARDMAEIIDRLGADRTVFVTHVDAHTPDGKPIAVRHRLISVVKANAARLCARSYDPTPLMRAVGQSAAMERDGLDLTHFTSVFADMLCAAWHRELISLLRAEPAVGIATPVASPASLEAQWLSGDWRRASSEVRALVRAGSHLPAFDHLLGRMAFDLGDFEGAIISLELARAELGASEECDLLLMRANFALSRWVDALRYGRSLLSDETETPEILRACAMAAGAIGNADEALQHWQRLFHIGHDLTDAATAALELLIATGAADAAAAWCETVMRAKPLHVPSIRYLWTWHTGRRDRAALTLLTSAAAALGDDETLKLAEATIANKLFVPAAQLIAVREGAMASDAAATLAAQWAVEGAAMLVGAEGSAMLAGDDLIACGDLIEASWILRPDNKHMIPARRRVRQTLRRRVREAFRGRDFAMVVGLCASAIEIGASFPQLDHFLGRAAAELNDFELALRHLRIAASEGDRVASGLRLARTAIRAERHLDALQACCALLAAAGPEDHAATQEARRILASLASSAVKTSRKLVADGDAVAAWKLLGEIRRQQPDNALAEREQARIHSALRKQILSVDISDAASRLALGHAILSLAPLDPLGLKTSGVAAMRLHKFAEALEHWTVLRDLSDNDQKIDRNILKCRMFIERRAMLAAAAAANDAATATGLRA